MPTTLDPSRMHDSILPHVDREVLTFNPNQTVEEALDLAAANPVKSEKEIVYFYVVDDARRLVGIVGTRQLLFAPRNAKIGTLMKTDVTAIPSWATVLVASEYFANRRFLAFPVVESDGTLVGVVDVEIFNDQLITAARQVFDEMFSLAGVHVTAGRTVWSGFQDRFPWLMCNVAGGLLCAVFASRYERLLSLFVILSLFVPVVLALGESVSIQSLTLTLQTLRSESTDWRQFLRSVRREIGVAALLGLGCGSLVGGTAWLWKAHDPMAFAIGGAICLSMITAALVGLTLPTIINAVKGNAHIAAGPIVLATVDLVTLLFYFQGATWLASRW